MENLNPLIIGEIVGAVILFLGLQRLVLGVDKTQALQKETNDLLKKLLNK